jgi:DNA-binding CsgD family transcriptional regulator
LALVGTMASTLGSAPLLTRVEDLGKQVRGGRPHDEPWRPLTVREFEVARLVANGLTNAEIAAELSLSPRTVSAHLEHILAKLGVSRRAEVAAWTAAITTPATGVATHGADATALAR